MRLLNVTTMKLESYLGTEIPPYVILSHCWGADEVTFQDLNGTNWHDKQGARKIDLACSHCRKNPPFTWDAPKINRICNHIWIDTCCIDKSSSAELSEAINSMYDWYAASQVCYAYLENIERLDDTTDVNIKLLRNSTWFSRGWTLQELIAPKKVEFFDKDWKFLQNKQEGRSLLSQITTIPQDILLYPSPANMERYSVARKMTWAAHRETTRLEDVAYSLLGIFGVNMPLLYGEGKKAFIRLQEEILKETNDQSLIAWGFNSEQPLIETVIAKSPKAFLGCEEIIPFPGTAGRQPYTMTNRGLRIELPIMELPIRTHKEGLRILRIAILDCQVMDDFSGFVGIALEETSEESVFTRHVSRAPKVYSDLSSNEVEIQTVYLAKKLPEYKPRGPETCLIRSESMNSYGYQIVQVLPS